LLLVRVGRLYELYGRGAEAVGKAFGMKTDDNRRDLLPECGFLARFLKVFIEKILDLKKDVAVLEGRPGKYVRERYVAKIYRTKFCNA
jgi:DNA mismatch repair ATPase MutS